jgi:hypothetical protein
MKGGQMVIPDGGAVAMLRALIKREPYNWQKRLLCGWLLAGRLPAAIDIPTGLGKTTTMAVWLAAFGSGARLPRRWVYVVDRRAVVDQATEEADKLAEALGDGSVDEIEIATLRETLGLRRGQRLPVSTLRGQHVDNREWLENPAAPVIVVGTVDMIGSRLLFEGYGIGPRMPCPGGTDRCRLAANARRSTSSAALRGAAALSCGNGSAARARSAFPPDGIIGDRQGRAGQHLSS